MGILQPWNIAFAIGLVIYIVIRGKFIPLAKENELTDRRVGTLEKVLLGAMVVTSLLLPMVYLFTPLLSFANYELPDAVRCVGLFLMTAGLWLFWRSHVDLGANWSPTLETRKGHEVIRHGVYRRIRHPMYAAIWLVSFGQALMLNNWLAGWSVVVAFALMYFTRVPQEEKMMLDHFGDDYRNYMSQTGRVMPSWRVQPTEPRVDGEA